LLYEEKKSQDRKGDSDAGREGALAIKHGSKPKWKQGIRCHYCKKIGHMQKDCYEFKKNRDDKLQRNLAHLRRPDQREIQQDL
jgi:hypothetical protein